MAVWHFQFFQVAYDGRRIRGVVMTAVQHHSNGDRGSEIGHAEPHLPLWKGDPLRRQEPRRDDCSRGQCRSVKAPRQDAQGASPAALSTRRLLSPRYFPITDFASETAGTVLPCVPSAASCDGCLARQPEHFVGAELDSGRTPP